MKLLVLMLISAVAIAAEPSGNPVAGSGPASVSGLPRDAIALESANWPENYRVHVELAERNACTFRWSKDFQIALSGGRSYDVAIEHPKGEKGGAPVVRAWVDGKLVRGPEQEPKLSGHSGEVFKDAKIDLGSDFTVLASFRTRGNGTLVSKCAVSDKWAPDQKALFIRGGRLVYDIGWLGAMSGGQKVNDGSPHTVVVSVKSARARMWLDGKLVAEKAKFSRPDGADDVLKVGSAAPDFGGVYEGGTIGGVSLWGRALDEGEVALLFKGGGERANTPDFEWSPGAGSERPEIETESKTQAGWVQALESADHGKIVSEWNEKTLAEGKRIYETLCIVCHGTKEQVGSLPTALRFSEGVLKNGADPYSMYVTLTRGSGQMVPQPQYTTEQKYSVIQYIRETYLRPYNRGQLTELTEEYVASLPKGMASGKLEQRDNRLPPYERMEFGPAMFWTLEVAPGNIASKGIAVRLDDGPGGVSKGRAWLIYDHDTMRVAAASTGGFVDWRGIAFDGSHGTHTSLTGERHFVNRVGPGWAGPNGEWDDVRLKGRDGKCYGPLPREWVHYEGLHLNGSRVVIAMKVGGVEVLEMPGWIDYGTTPVFTRTIEVGTSSKTLKVRVAPTESNVTLTGGGELRKEGGDWIAELKGGSSYRLCISKVEQPALDAFAASLEPPVKLEPLTHGGPARWPQEVVTMSEAGAAGGAFEVDTFLLPELNPWQSWMRPGGFDFSPDGKSVIVAMWNGDVWRAEGIYAKAPAPVRWHRIAAGLFQPLGVKFRGEELFVTCRDQLARLRDMNGDGEVDYIENFNNDHQVTEHFHEFAMGLQVDAKGNFYYAKSARHALPAIVPQHGTLLRVSADGLRTDILATGFRAANGVCLNQDGSFFVTDQEGHWTPKNRINHVQPGGFYGNLYGYTSVTDTSDEAMQPPMVWITNAKDRSPAELLWVPKGAWGTLGGALLNLSYGTGRVFIVPHEEVDGTWQGAVCELPLPAFATGIMRGRFGGDGALYTCGMFAWAGNATAPGGFHRVRAIGERAAVPIAVEAHTGRMVIRFSDALDPASVEKSGVSMKAWSLKRSANYGSPHVGERVVPISKAWLEGDGKTVVLEVPGLSPMQCYEVRLKARDASGTPVERSMHGTVHKVRLD